MMSHRLSPWMFYSAVVCVAAGCNQSKWDPAVEPSLLIEYEPPPAVDAPREAAAESNRSQAAEKQEAETASTPASLAEATPKNEENGTKAAARDNIRKDPPTAKVLSPLRKPRLLDEAVTLTPPRMKYIESPEPPPAAPSPSTGSAKSMTPPQEKKLKELRAGRSLAEKVKARKGLRLPDSFK